MLPHVLTKRSRQGKHSKLLIKIRVILGAFWKDTAFQMRIDPAKKAKFDTLKSKLISSNDVNSGYYLFYKKKNPITFQQYPFRLPHLINCPD